VEAEEVAAAEVEVVGETAGGKGRHEARLHELIRVTHRTGRHADLALHQCIRVDLLHVRHAVAILVLLVVLAVGVGDGKQLLVNVGQRRLGSGPPGHAESLDGGDRGAVAAAEEAKAEADQRLEELPAPHVDYAA